MCVKGSYKTVLLWSLVAMAILVGIAMALIQTLAVKSDELSYFETALFDTGLELKTMPYLIEEKYCANVWVDAVVYFKLRMSIVNSQQVINKIEHYHKYNGRLSLPQFPDWWKPGACRLHFVYYKDNYSASPIIVVDVDQKNDIAFVYIAVIPV